MCKRKKRARITEMKSGSLLVVVDMQNDFISGSLGTKEAESIVPMVADKIRSWDGDIIFTKDTHDETYPETGEGKKLPVLHCIAGTEGHELHPDILNVRKEYEEKRGRECPVLEKRSFGSLDLADSVKNGHYDRIEFVGLCTDICVISNVLIVKAASPESAIMVDASCCAGVTPQSHMNALNAMRACQIDVINAG